MEKIDLKEDLKAGRFIKVEINKKEPIKPNDQMGLAQLWHYIESSLRFSLSLIPKYNGAMNPDGNREALIFFRDDHIKIEVDKFKRFKKIRVNLE